MSNQFYERHFYADDWGSADAAYAAAVTHFEQLRAETDRSTTLESKDDMCRDGVNRPMLIAKFPFGGALFVMPSIVPDLEDPRNIRREMWNVRAQHPGWSPSQLRVFPGGRQDFDERVEGLRRRR